MIENLCRRLGMGDKTSGMLWDVSDEPDSWQLTVLSGAAVDEQIDLGILFHFVSSSQMTQMTEVGEFIFTSTLLYGDFSCLSITRAGRSPVAREHRDHSGSRSHRSSPVPSSLSARALKVTARQTLMVLQAQRLLGWLHVSSRRC